jgi:Outer membrane lipoprotein-sorting protein
MSSTSRTRSASHVRAGLSVAVAVAVSVAVSVAVAVPVRSSDQALSPQELLARSDLGALAPDSFRSRMRLSTTEPGRPPLEIEVWRRGEERTLVRFLGAKEQAKYLLRLGGALWFLAPGAKKPVRLGPAYRLRGATLDDVLGLRYARDYRVDGASDTGEGRVALELVARAPGALYPTIRYVVRRDTLRPVRAEYRLPSGKVATVVEFAAWADGRPPHASRLIVRDALHGGAVTTVEVQEVEERAVPMGLFDLADPTERRRLEASTPP